MSLFSRLVPFFMIGIAIVAFAFGIILLAYLFLLGAIVGSLLFIVHWIKEKYFPEKRPSKQTGRAGRTIDSDDWKVL